MRSAGEPCSRFCDVRLSKAVVLSFATAGFAKTPWPSDSSLSKPLPRYEGNASHSRRSSSSPVARSSAPAPSPQVQSADPASHVKTTSARSAPPAAPHINPHLPVSPDPQARTTRGNSAAKRTSSDLLHDPQPATSSSHRPILQAVPQTARKIRANPAFASADETPPESNIYISAARSIPSSLR